jgi:hypothetical protein
VSQKNSFRSVKSLTFSSCLILLLSATLFHVLLQAHASSPAAVPNTIFPDTSSATFTITTVGSSGSVSYTVIDLAQTLMLSGGYKVSAKQMTLTLPKQPDGYYTLTVFDHTVPSSPNQSIPFAIIAPLSPGFVGNDGTFGVGVHFGSGDGPAIAPLIAQLGVGSIRSDITWGQIEQAPGQYRFGSYDAGLQVFQQSNLSPLLILDYNNRFYDQGQTPYDTAGLSAFARYASAVVTHYGPQLKAVEIYNEYNGLFSTGPCARKPACYTQMLQYTYQAIKAVRPDVTVVGGAVFAADLLWFSQIFQDGALRSMDAVSDHPYPLINMLSPERAGFKPAMDGLQMLIKLYNHGVAKPIWITELGWPTSLLSVDERMQAQYLVRGAVLGLAAGVQKFFWYDCLNDGTNAYLSEQNFGLLRRPDAAGRYTPKPSFLAYATLTRQLAHQKFVSGGPLAHSIYDERFSSVHVIWSTDAGHRVLITSNSPLTVISMTGAARTYTPVAGQIFLSVSEDPIYLSASGITHITAVS